MEKFYTEPTLEAPNLLKKKELIDAAKHLNLCRLAEFCRTCHVCKMNGKPNKSIPVYSST